MQIPGRTVLSAGESRWRSSRMEKGYGAGWRCGSGRCHGSGSCLDHRKTAGRKQQEQKIRDQMMTDYPDILNKFTLLLNAGMNTRKTFTKSCPRLQKVDKQAGRKVPEEGGLRGNRGRLPGDGAGSAGGRSVYTSGRQMSAAGIQNICRASGSRISAGAAEKFWRSWSVRRWMHLKTGNAGLR